MHGQAVKKTRRKRPVAERFLEKVIKTDACWLWNGASGAGYQGYGTFWMDNAYWRAHRAAYVLFVGPIPDGLQILHSCDNDRCVNPGHLRPGTQVENMDDAFARGRAPNATPRETCIRGHALTPENTYEQPGVHRPHRECRICVRDAQRRCQERKRARAAA